MNPNNQFSGNSTPDQPSSPNDTFGASPEESNALQQVENSTPVSEPMESPTTPTVSPPVEAPKPFSPATPSSDSAPATPSATPSVATNSPKKSKKGLIIIASVLLVLGIAAASYFVWDALTPNETAPAASDTASTDQPPEEQLAPVENAEQLDAEIDAIEAELNAIDDSEFSDETISDATLEQ